MVTRYVKLFLVLVAVVLVMLIGVSDHAHAAKKEPDVIPPDQVYLGKSYGEWAASWWQAAFAVPVVNGEHPILNGGAFGGDDGVVFLATVVGTTTTLDITIPAETPLFVPVINAECSVIEAPPWHGDDEASLRACANNHIDQTSRHWAKIDGKHVQHIKDYRVESPLFEFGPLPENNILGVPGGTTSPSVDAGVYLLLAPLSVGEHEIHIRSRFDEFGLPIDTTFNITVLPGNP